MTGVELGPIVVAPANGDARVVAEQLEAVR